MRGYLRSAWVAAAFTTLKRGNRCNTCGHHSEASSQVTVDDTEMRHQGKNGCTTRSCWSWSAPTCPGLPMTPSSIAVTVSRSASSAPAREAALGGDGSVKYPEGFYEFLVAQPLITPSQASYDSKFLYGTGNTLSALSLPDLMELASQNRGTPKDVSIP